MAETFTPYSYRPVDSDHQGFRLAILQPSLEFPAPISCDLVEVVPGSKPVYEALSYVWGDVKDQIALTVEGSNLKVTANLGLALRYLRLPDKSRTIWVDAICIDQSNINERSSQVRLMKMIYSSCSMDLVWLGEANEDTQQGIDSLRKMKSLDFRRVPDGKIRSFEIKNSGDRVSFNDLGLDLAECYGGLCSLLKRPTLWERVWVMQEISCSPEALIVIGYLTIPWNIISSVLDHSGVPDRYHTIFTHQSYVARIWDIFRRVQVIEHQRKSFSMSIPLNSTLIDVLSRFRATSSSDPRDKIYGLLGLATDNLSITPDYRKSPQEVYIEVVREQINSTQDLDVITQSLWPLGSLPVVYDGASTRHLYSDDSSSVVENLPSWLPNFSYTEATKILFAQRSIFAAGRSKCVSPIPMTSDGILSVSGTVLGAVSTMKFSEDFYTYWSTWLPFNLLDINSQPQTYITGGDAFEAYWRTLMTDCIAFPTRRLDEDDIKEYREFFNEWRRVTFSNSQNHDGSVYDPEPFRNRMLVTDRKSGMRDLRGKWQFGELEGGLYAMIPWDSLSRGKRVTRVGDIVVSVDGGKVPLVLRKKTETTSRVRTEGSEEWEVIGTAYVHGFMNGLADEYVYKGLLERMDFDLV